MFAILWAASLRGDSGEAIHGIAVSRGFFNPTFGQRVLLTFETRVAGRARITVLDRDGFAVRRLSLPEPVPVGKVVFDWDGRDEQGRVVPDEVYAFRIEVTGAAGTSVWEPRLHGEEVTADQISHSPQEGILSYRLAKAARVHVQAGCVKPDPKTKESFGPVLMTVVNREPRLAGTVREYWNGKDESGAISVPDLPGFVVGVLATALPEHSVIATGNRKEAFVDWARRRTGAPVTSHAAGGEHMHHSGLTTLDDVSPRLRIRPAQGTRAGSDGIWGVEDEIEIAVALEGVTAATFGRQPGMVVVFLNEDPVVSLKARAPPLLATVPLTKVPPGVHRLTVNWISEWGPVSVNTIRVRVAERRVAAAKP